MRLFVGSLPGARGGAVLDFYGNAADWAAARDGLGIALGPSADLGFDSLSDIRPSLAYTDFRVVAGSQH